MSRLRVERREFSREREQLIYKPRGKKNRTTQLRSWRIFNIANVGNTLRKRDW